MPDVWLPGIAGPQEEFVARVHRQIERFAADAGIEMAFVEIELVDGARFTVESITAEPGFGFVTIRPYAGDDPDIPGELIVPVGSIRRIELDRAEEQRARFGFSVPAE